MLLGQRIQAIGNKLGQRIHRKANMLGQNISNYAHNVAAPQFMHALDDGYGNSSTVKKIHSTLEKINARKRLQQ